MNWKVSLDRYLTTEHNEYFDGWCESALDALSDDFYAANEDWVDSSELLNKWLNKLFGKEPKEAAIIIEKAFRIFKLNQTK